MPESKPRRRWYHITPDRLIIGLVAVEGFLLLSERFQWFAFNEKKGWTVLIAVAAVCLAVVVMLLWLVVSLLFRWRFQFSLRSLVVLVVAVAVPCCWLTVKMREAERQRRAVLAIEKAGGGVLYDYEADKVVTFTGQIEPPASAWLWELVGKDFFSDAISVQFLFRDHGEYFGLDGNEADVVGLEYLKGLTALKSLLLGGNELTDARLEHITGLTSLEDLLLLRTQVTDGGLERLQGLTNLEQLALWDTQVTDAGLQHLRGMEDLRALYLYDTHVTDRGIKGLQQALPNCNINESHP